MTGMCVGRNRSDIMGGMLSLCVYLYYLWSLAYYYAQRKHLKGRAGQTLHVETKQTQYTNRWAQE